VSATIDRVREATVDPVAVIRIAANPDAAPEERPEADVPEGDRMTTPTTVDEYLADLPDDRRAVVEELRGTINAAAPEATETIAYQMPSLRGPDGRFLLSYASFKSHYSLFPASDEVIKALGAEVRPYLAGQATIRFPVSRPIPLDLVTKVVQVRVKENGAQRDRLRSARLQRGRRFPQPEHVSAVTRLATPQDGQRRMPSVDDANCVARLVLAAVVRSRSRMAATATTPTAAATIRRTRMVVWSMHVPRWLEPDPRPNSPTCPKPSPPRRPG